jgi:hypothetical protein
MICMTCKRDLPIERFAWTPKKRRSRRCSGCKRRATTSVKRWHEKGRKCSRCATTVPCPAQITDFPWRDAAVCKACIRAGDRDRQREWARVKRATDPDFRRRSAEASKRWQQANLARVYAAERERYRRIRQDPERHAAYKETIRMRYRLRREQDGAPVKPVSEKTYLKNYGTGVSKFKVVPIDPLLEMLREAVETIGEGAVADVSGIPARRLYDYLHRRQANVSIIAADKLCVYFGTPFSLVYGDTSTV